MYTGAAEQAIHTAKRFAMVRNHEYIGTEHLLLGLLGLDDSAVHGLLAGWDVKALRAKLDARMPDGAAMETFGMVPWTPRALRALKAARENAGGDAHIETRDLLHGVVAAGGLAYEVMRELGDVKRVLSATRRVPRTEAVPVAQPVRPSRAVKVDFTVQEPLENMSLRDHLAVQATISVHGDMIDGFDVETQERFVGRKRPAMKADGGELGFVEWCAEAEARIRYAKADAMLRVRRESLDQQAVGKVIEPKTSEPPRI